MPVPADILVVDDEAEIVAFITEALAEEGYAVRIARDGASALIDIQTHPPALVLLDNAMPVMTGCEVLVRLRDSGFDTLPIIMMSAGLNAEIFVELGATDFLPKPFNLDALLSSVARYFPLHSKEA
jgi:two-component system, OmpR family, response regulator MprA